MTTSSREAVARGDILALIDSLGPDESYVAELPAESGIPGGGTFARIGRTQVAVRTDGAVQVHTHDTEQEAHECFTWNVERLERINAVITEALPRGQMAMYMAIAGLLTEEADEDGPTVPVPAAVPAGPFRGRAQVREVRSDSDEPTGMYL